MALNQMQQQAVQHTEGPLLILAGAGSGKTTVLVNRVQHIIADGYALPWQVLAITFTNKAAGRSASDWQTPSARRRSPFGPTPSTPAVRGSCAGLGIGWAIPTTLPFMTRTTASG